MSGSSNSLKTGARSDGKAISIESVSDEILLMILKSVITPLQRLCDYDTPDSPSSSQNILNIALCSRRFFEIAEPFLFHQLEDKDARIGKKALQLFLCRILAKPDMKKHVYRIQTKAQLDGICGDASMDLSMIRADDWQRICEAVHTCGSSAEESRNWIHDMENGHWDGFIALLLCIAPNLQELHIADWGQYDAYPFLTTVLGRAAELQKRSVISARSLLNLKAVSLLYWDMTGGMGMDTFELFLALQSVTSLEGCKVEVEEWHDPDPATWGPIAYDYSKGYSLKRLDLHNASIGPDSLIEILRRFPYLEQLSYVHQGFQKFAPPAVMAGLKHLESCLQELTLSYYEEEDFGGDLWNFPIGSLVTFQKLRYLDMSQTVLIGSDEADSEYDNSGTFKSTQDLVTSLPPKLEHLCIRDYDHRIVEPVFELIAKKSLYAPALRFLDLSFTRIVFPDKDSELILEQPGFTKGEVLKLLAECEAAGVEMVATGIPPPDKSIRLLIEGRKFELYFPYPYSEYKKWCEHYGCEFETGVSASFDPTVWHQAAQWKGDFSKIVPSPAKSF